LKSNIFGIRLLAREYAFTQMYKISDKRYTDFINSQHADPIHDKAHKINNVTAKPITETTAYIPILKTCFNSSGKKELALIWLP